MEGEVEGAEAGGEERRAGGESLRGGKLPVSVSARKERSTCERVLTSKKETS